MDFLLEDLRTRSPDMSSEAGHTPWSWRFGSVCCRLHFCKNKIAISDLMDNKTSTACSVLTSVYLSVLLNYTESPMDRKHPNLPPALSLPLQCSTLLSFSAVHFTGIFDRVVNFTSDKSFGLVYKDKISMAGNTTVGRQWKLRKPPFPPLLLRGFIPMASSWCNTKYRESYSIVKVLLFRTGCQKSDYDLGESL